jgi:hypothetical protein
MKKSRWINRKSGVCGFRVTNIYHQGIGEEGGGISYIILISAKLEKL